MFACRPWKSSAIGCANVLEKLQNSAYPVAWPDGWLRGVRFPLYQDFLQTRDRPFAGLADVVIGDRLHGPCTGTRFSPFEFGQIADDMVAGRLDGRAHHFGALGGPRAYVRRDEQGFSASLSEGVNREQLPGPHMAVPVGETLILDGVNSP